MSLGTVAIIEHGHSLEKINNLQALLSELGSQLFVEEITGPTDDWKWRLDQRFSSVAEEISAYGNATLSLKGHYSLLVGHRCLAIGHRTLWRDFLTVRQVQTRLRSNFGMIAASLGASRAIYTPDGQFCPARALDLVSSQKCLGIAEIIAYLSSDCSPPARTLESIFRLQDNGCWTGDGYFIENFDTEWIDNRGPLNG